MILRIEHLGIAVADPVASQDVFDRLLNQSAYKTEEVSSESVQTTFYAVGNTKLELISDSPEGEVVRKFIAKRGEGPAPHCAGSRRYCGRNRALEE